MYPRFWPQLEKDLEHSSCSFTLVITLLRILEWERNRNELYKMTAERSRFTIITQSLSAKQKQAVNGIIDVEETDKHDDSIHEGTAP